MTKAPTSWSCDERNRKECRNSHGYHCAEITALVAVRDEWHQAADIALEQARRDREYTAAQTGESVKLVNQVLVLQAERDSARQQRDALALQVAILTNERDEARAQRRDGL